MNETEVNISEVKETPRGFFYIEFNDKYDVPCSLQESSADGANIWFGVDEKRMHLTQEHAKKLLPFLQKFAETGEAFRD